MYRALLAVVVGLGITMGGCAVAVEDPIPPTPAPEAQRAPPQVPLNTELRDPSALLMGAAEISHGLDGVPPKLVLPLPGPIPETN